MIVVEQRERDVRPRPRELLDAPEIDERVAQTLEDQRRLRDGRLEGVVPETILVERDVEQPFLALRVVKEREGAFAAPFVDALGRQHVTAGLSERDGGREEHESID